MSRFTLRKSAAGLTAAAMLLGSASAFASSHREAPAISQDPVADTTDVYAWMSSENNLVLAANYYPLQVNPSGPNYYRFGDDVAYAINIDNNGDAKADWAYVFRFKTTTKNGGTFLFNTGANNTSGDTNVAQTYDLYKIRGELKTESQLTNATRVVSNADIATPVIGPKSQPDYDRVAESAVAGLSGGGKVFAGVRDDPFFVDLKVFDLLNLGSATASDSLAGANVQSLVVEVPKDSVLSGDPVIGVWSTSYRRSVRVVKTDGTTKGTGKYIQVSRLGMPLVNEVVVPLAAKDYFNASVPYDDAGKNFGAYSAVVLKPELAGLFKAVLGLDAPTENRTDLVTVFLTGVPGLNKPASANARPSEMLRLNTSTEISGNPNRLGVFGGDNQGFPNGRRLADDVTDIAVQAVAGKLVDGYDVPAELGDGINGNDKEFLDYFPYLASPHLVR